MKFLDFIRYKLNPDVDTSFKKSYPSNKTAIETIIANPHIFSKKGLNFITEETTTKTLISDYNKIVPSINQLFKNKIPIKFSFKQKKYLVDNFELISKIYNKYKEEYDLNQVVLSLQKTYPNAFKEYCKSNNIDQKAISNTSKRQIKSNKNLIISREKEIQKIKRHKYLEAKFEEEVIKNNQRNKYYKSYFTEYSSDDEKEFVLKHLEELDEYCKFQRKYEVYEALTFFVKDYLLDNNLTENDYGYIMKDYISQQKFENYAKNKIEKEYNRIQKKIPLGVKEYENSISSHCLWPANFRDANEEKFREQQREWMDRVRPILNDFNRNPIGINDIIIHNTSNQPEINKEYKSDTQIEKECREFNEKEVNRVQELTKKFLCIKNKEKVKEFDKVYKNIEEIKNKYPGGFELFLTKNTPKEDGIFKINVDEIIRRSRSKPKLQLCIVNLNFPNTEIKGKSYLEFYKEIIKHEDKIKELDNISSYAKNQEEFSKYIRNLIREITPSWGAYSYEIPVEYGEKWYGPFKKPSIKFKIWQFFVESFSDVDIDYSKYPDLAYLDIDNEVLREGRETFKTGVYDKILDLIKNIQFEDYNPITLFADTDELWEVYHKSSHFLYLRCILNNYNIPEHEFYSYVFYKQPKNVISVIDLITYKTDLLRFASSLFNNLEDQPLVFYISLRKEISEDEVEKLIQKTNNKIKEEERKQQEEESIQINLALAKSLAEDFPEGYRHYFPGLPFYDITPDKAEQIITKSSDIKNYHNLVLEMRRSAESWGKFKNIPYYFFYYYYPKRFTDITAESQKARNLIYNFKDGIPTSNPIYKLVGDKLKETFTSDELKELTFVGIPASTRVSNQQRYEEFCRNICDYTGMKNAYPYITIEKEKTPAHLSPNHESEPAIYGYDSEFFKYSKIIIFDDVVTKGDSLLKMKLTLEKKFGCSIIGAISLGRTYSAYKGDNRLPHPYSGVL